MIEKLKQALEALEANDQLINGSGTKGGLVYCMDNYYSDCFDVDPINKQTDEAIAAIKEALAQQEQEPVAWVDLQKEAQQIVKSKALWKKFIDGTPLANDIACWMTDFALQHTHPPQRTEPKVCLRSRNEEMTQDEIIEMALVVGTIEDGDLFVFKHHELEAFAKLVAAKAEAKEREACAKVILDSQVGGIGTAVRAAYLIRARGEE